MEREEMLSMNSNPIVQELGKLPEEWQREDLLELIERRGIKSVHLRYPAADGRLKELKIAVQNRRQIERLLANGERADGSSLFPGIMDHASGDIYVVPIYRTAFLDPFAENTLDICCRFYDREGKPSLLTSDNTLARAVERFTKKTGLELHALAEVEYYLIFSDDATLFPSRRQSGYHEAGPFLKREQVTDEIITILSRITGHVKYTHGEVGNLIGENYTDCPELDGKLMEQHEVEFHLAPVEDMARYVLISKWVIRNVAAKHGCNVTFAPKLDEGDAGNGLHIHCACRKNGKSVMLDSAGALSKASKKIIAGMLDHAPSLMAFGNTVPSAYLRLVPNQEAPTKICWSESNRCAMPYSRSAGRTLTTLRSAQTRPSGCPSSPAKIHRPSNSACLTARRTCTCCWPACVWRWRRGSRRKLRPRSLTAYTLWATSSRTATFWLNFRTSPLHATKPRWRSIATAASTKKTASFRPRPSSSPSTGCASTTMSN